MSSTPRATWSDLPFAVRRLAVWGVLPLMSMGAGVVVAFGGVAPLVGLGSWWGVAIPVLMFAPLFIAIAAVSMGMRRMKRVYAASGGRLCPTCASDLRELGESGSCSTCGGRFDVERDRRGWSRAGVAGVTGGA